MGVYNPNADMPVSCAECDTRGGSNCFLSNQLSYPDVLRRRHPDCPLVEVPTPLATKAGLIINGSPVTAIAALHIRVSDMQPVVEIVTEG